MGGTGRELHIFFIESTCGRTQAGRSQPVTMIDPAQLRRTPSCCWRELSKVRHTGVLLVLLLAWFGRVAAQPGQQRRPSEYEVKAAYLYNFGKFVRWPARVQNAGIQVFPVCVLGEDPFGPLLDGTLAGESLDGKKVVARRVASAQQAGECRMVFIASSESGHLKKILDDLKMTPVLTVSDMPEFTDRGGMIGFINDNGRVRFEVNLAAAQQAGLTLSSDLLRVAKAVKGTSPQGE